MTWEPAFKAALAADDVPGMVACLDPLATAHAGTAPAAVKQKVARQVAAACKTAPDRQLRLGLAFCCAASLTGQEIGAVLVAPGYAAAPAEVAAALLDLADSPNWEVREWAAQGCGLVLSRHFDASYPVIFAWTGHASANVRRAVALAAMYAGDPARPEWAGPLLDLVEPLLPDPDEYVRKNLGPFAIGDGLLRYYPEATLARVGRWAVAEDSGVRWNAAMVASAASAARHAAALAPLVRALQADADAAVRRAAQKAWRNLEQRAPDEVRGQA